jgi:uridine kinase
MSQKDQSKSFVIAITGSSGAGKTSLVKAVTSLWDDAVSFYFDDYDSTHQCPENIEEWVNKGIDPHQWKNPRLLEDLHLLSHGTPVTPPNSQREIKPARIIVMEEPFGRTREGMGELVDFVACIDVPLEIPLARRILRELDGVMEKKTSEEYIKQLRGYLHWFVNESGRDMYFQVNEKAKETCDLVVDGRKSVDEMAKEVVQGVKRKMAR